MWVHWHYSETHCEEYRIGGVQSEAEVCCTLPLLEWVIWFVKNVYRIVSALNIAYCIESLHKRQLAVNFCCWLYIAFYVKMVIELIFSFSSYSCNPIMYVLAVLFETILFLCLYFYSFSLFLALARALYLCRSIERSSITLNNHACKLHNQLDLVFGQSCWLNGIVNYLLCSFINEVILCSILFT